MPIKFDLKKYLNEVYIETGFYKGESLNEALNCGFKKLHSIEINNVFYNEGLNVFKKIENVFLYNGTSRLVLPEILKQLDKRATFFLDAHDLDYQGIEKYKFKKIDECPVMEEIDIIKQHFIKNHTIIIDDIRIFDGTDNNGIRYSWAKDFNISSDIIKIKILEINNNYKFKLEKGVVENDVLIAYVN